MAVTAEEGFIESGETKVGGVGFTYKDIQVSRNMSDAEFAALTAELDKGMVEGDTALSYINRAYQTALGTDLGVNTFEELFDNLYAPIIDGNGNQRYQLNINADSKIAQAAVSGYVAGRRVMNLTLEDYKERIRYLKEESLQKGDLLMVNDLMLRVNYYIYLGEGQDFIKINDNGVSSAAVAPTLDTLIALPLWSLFRPSMIN